MNQSALMFFALVISYIVFVTMKGQLSNYMCVLGI